MQANETTKPKDDERVDDLLLEPEAPRPSQGVAIGAPRTPTAWLADEREPNIRLQKTRPGSPERLIYAADYGEYYAPRPYVRFSGVEYDLPCLPNGDPDFETQKRGWFMDPNYAYRVARQCPEYKLVQVKGDRP